jgi:hypothetical protein
MVTNGWDPLTRAGTAALAVADGEGCVCAAVMAVQDPQLLPEQQEFELLLLLRPTHNRDKIEQQHPELGDQTVNHSTSGPGR